MMKAANRTLLVTVLLWLASLSISAFVAYSAAHTGSLQRVTAVEVQQQNDSKRLDRIEVKLDRLFEYITGSKP